jgi:O-antigen ligase
VVSSIRENDGRTTARRWGLGLVAGVLFGAAALTPLPLLFAGAGALAAAYAFVRTPARSAIAVGLFWVAFGAYYSAFAGAQIDGLFYPFYAVFFLTVLVRTVRQGVQTAPAVVWSYLVLMLVVLVSLLGFTGTVDFQVLKRLLAYAFGALVPLQFVSKTGLRMVAVLAGVASLLVSGWIIASAARGGFGYRADIHLDQNAVAFFIGLGAATAGAYLMHWIARRGTAVRFTAVLLLFGAMLYAMLLLASRGMAISLSVAMLALTLRAARDDRRKALFLVALLTVVSAGFLLPGGQELFTRFHSDRVASAGSRVPIWEVTLSAVTKGSPVEVLLGHGFDSSRPLVRSNFVVLTSTHNAYLEMLYEFGLVGLGAFVLMHLLLLWRALRIRGPDGYVMVALTTFLLAADLTVNAPDGFMYWTALGFVIASGYVAERASPPARPVETTG